MDDWTREHLARWCQRQYPDVDQAFDLFNKMSDFLSEHPDLEGKRSWPEVRELVERELA